MCFFGYFKLNRDGRWQISPMEGHIEPESESELCVTLYLIDADTYSNKAVIQLEKVKDIVSGKSNIVLRYDYFEIFRNIALK